MWDANQVRLVLGLEIHLTKRLKVDLGNSCEILPTLLNKEGEGVNEGGF